ncbi:MAG: hypothetical protein GW809_08875 [Bacteroidetes bacterium]|nr:hypothetical protein [Bacteroidota bacterium]NCQ12232.1 hypothetical protein [Bacteroidota bacterium]
MNKQFDYFKKNIQLFYEIEGLDIGYGEEGNHKIYIKQSIDDSFWQNLQDINPEQVVWKSFRDVSIPFLFETNPESELITIHDRKISINYDIVASSFYFLSGWNEHVNPIKDEFGRISYKNSIIKQLNCSNIPVVNYYFEILNEAIELAYQTKSKKKTWQEHNLAVSLTHDIDTCLSAWLQGGFSELKKKKLFSMMSLILKRIFKEDDWFNFKTIVDLEKSFGATSSFYFLAKKGNRGKWKNGDYDIRDKKMQKALTYLKETGNEVGVHGSFGTHNDSKRFKHDIEIIQSKPIQGNRFHFLMFDPEKTVSVLEDNEIQYDTSLGFAEQIGFRRATCYPFFLYNFEKDRISTVIEIPLIVMDGTLSNKKYMGLEKEAAVSKVFELIDEIAKFNGVFTLLWHNTHFSEYKYTGWNEVYQSLLAYSKEKKGLLTNGKIIHDRISQL